MRFHLQTVIPKKDREAADAAGEIFYRFIKSIDNYPLNQLKTVYVMDGHPMHRKPKTLKHLKKLGISVQILPPSSSELNPIEKCKLDTTTS